MEGKLRDLTRKSVLVVGMGISGIAAAEFLLAQGAFVCGIDQSAHLLETNSKVTFLKSKGAQILLENQVEDISKYDLIVISPGIPKTHFIYREALKRNSEMIGEMELACRFAKQPLIGITGTNGKTTVTSLVTHILNQSGFFAQALGNIGEPLSSQLLTYNKNSIGVVELSSFQLETLQTPVFKCGVILNITPDHLDRYTDMTHYAQAKIHLKDCLKKDGRLYVEEKCYEEYRELFQDFTPLLYGYSPENFLYYDQQQFIIKNSLSCLLPNNYHQKKNHEIENMMAAFGVCQEFNVSVEQFIKGVLSFKKPPHRIEFVDEIHGISYFDDSKGTNIDAVMRAVESLPGKIILIAGGVDKGASYEPWIKAFQTKVKSICAIGEASQKIKNELGFYFPVHIHSTLEEAVSFATHEALSGENVLLSPGCASFDMFKNYAHRGEEFKKVVKSLKK